jgi:indolepyruvate ferredoxin oxidoreductase beta subunit
MSVDKCVNIVVCGTGGQGNVLLSRFLGRAFVKKGYYATIGETFGMSQRGGAVMSHVRISREKQYGPLIPKGQGHIILSLEPMETIRVLGDYGNPSIAVISNIRPVYPVISITGEEDYPDLEEVKRVIREMSGKCWFLDATQISLEMGNTILTNMIMMGALAESKVVDLTESDLRGIIEESFSGDSAQTNISAVSRGMRAVRG